VIAAGDDVVVEFINRGTNTGPISTAQGDFPATNRRIEVPYCSVMRIQAGKVVSGRDYYDVYTILRQLDLIT
jgi:ketosteroid isomerase-like protein